MPNSHNGYYDTILEMGYVGLLFLLAFILVTLHGVGRVADRDPGRAQLALSLALFVILWNFFESIWMRGFEFLWVMFVIVAAEIGRYWLPVPLRRAAPGSRSQGSGSPGLSPARRRFGLVAAPVGRTPVRIIWRQAAFAPCRPPARKRPPASWKLQPRAAVPARPQNSAAPGPELSGRSGAGKFQIV